jgi:hypothetical protein
MRRLAMWALALAMVTACGRAGGPDDWDAAAVRAVARAEGAEGPLVVLDRVGGPQGRELPWGVRQSLTTGGIQLTGSDAPPDPVTRVLVLDASRRDGSDWLVDTRTIPPDGPAMPATWRVSCANGSCNAAPAHD